MLGDSTAYFDNLDDLDSLEMAASGMNVDVDRQQLEVAREAIEEKMAEESDDDYDPEPDYDADDDHRGSGTPQHSEGDRVDSLFDRLAE